MTEMHETSLLRRMGMSLVGKAINNRFVQRNISVLPEIGSRFMQTTPNTPVWVVQTVMNVKTSQFPLVHLTSERYPDLLKVVSLSALYDDEEFIPATVLIE